MPALDLTLLDEQLYDDSESAPSDAPGGWIANGSEHDTDTSPAAQGRRAALCGERIRAAHAIREMQEGACDYRIAELRRRIAVEEQMLSQLAGWEADRTQWYRAQLREWRLTNPDLNAGSTKSIVLGDNLRLGARGVNPPAKINWLDTDAAKDILPDSCWGPRPFKVGEAKKLVEVHGEAVVITATGEVLPPTVATAHKDAKREVIYIRVGDKEIELEAPPAASDEAEDARIDTTGEASGADGADAQSEPNPDPEFDPFGDDEGGAQNGCTTDADSQGYPPAC